MEYTFTNEVEARHVHDVFSRHVISTIKIDNISACEYNNEFNAYFVIYNSNEYFIYTNRIHEFEAMLPEFPYNKEKHKIKTTDERLDRLEKQMAALLSHIEALLTISNLRLPTDDPLG